MIENIIRVNREEFDRLSLLTEKEGYIAQTVNIATQDLFPLHKIHYVFDNLLVHSRSVWLDELLKDDEVLGNGIET